MKSTSQSEVVPTSGYTISLALACVGFACLGISIGGGLIARQGGDPIDALDVDGMVTFALAFAIMFAARLIFFDRVSLPVRNAVRALITAVLVGAIFATIGSAWLAFYGSHDKRAVSLPIYFTVFAAICQVASVVWLLRYRQEGVRS